MKKQITVIDMRESGTERKFPLRLLIQALRKCIRSVRDTLIHRDHEPPEP